MKKILFSCLAVLAFAACQNSESSAPNASDATSKDASKPAQNAEMFQPEKVAGRIQASLDDIKNISGELDALPDKVKKAKATEIAEIRNMVEALTEKQTALIQELNAPAQPGAGGAGASSIVAGASSNAAAVENAVESMSRYQKDVEQMKAQLQALKGN